MKTKGMINSPGLRSAIASIISILFGLAFGFVLLLIFNAPHAIDGMKGLLGNGFSAPAKFAKVLYQAAPLIMAGLSVGFAFKTGLFNIGASGQYTVGACTALVLAIYFQQSWIVCMIGAMIAGAIWGFFPGWFKAVFNVNEVITSIMFNWISLFLGNLIVSNVPNMLASHWGDAQTDRTANLVKANPGAIIPKAGLDTLLGSNYMNISIFIAIIMAIIIYIVLQKTVFGYELKACGFNKNASVYAGINAKRNIILSMVIAGALSGVGGGIYYLAGLGQYNIDKVLLIMGFNGIPVALLAASNPIATIFSALFISYIQVGGDAMQPEFARENIDIIIAVIIYLSAFSLLMKTIIGNILTRKQAEKHTKLSGTPVESAVDGVLKNFDSNESFEAAEAPGSGEASKTPEPSEPVESEVTDK